MRDWTSDGEEWRGKERKSPNDGPPKFGRKARRWFRHAVFHWLRSHPTKGPPHVGSDGLAWRVADWYLEQHDVYVVWVPNDGYHGPRFSWGSWELNEAAVERDVRLGLQEVHNRCTAVVADSIASLDDWLRADMNGTLPIAGAVGASVLFSEERKERLRSRVRSLTEYGPRECRTCGHRFKADRRHIYCRDCRAAGKAPAVRRYPTKACAACHGPYEPHHWNTKWCEACRTGTQGEEQAAEHDSKHGNGGTA